MLIEARKIPAVALFTLGMLGLSLAAAAPSSILPPRVQTFFYYLEETGKRSDYKSIWERVADSLILSGQAVKECAKQAGALEPRG